jgi:gluconokinase
LKSGGDVIIACSALKESYRATLVCNNDGVRLIFLKGSFELIAQRLAMRHDHFFDPALLRSQFEALEEPPDAIVVGIAGTPAEIVAAIRARLA